MKRLALLRHAKSGWDDPGLRDFDRGLNDRGRRAAAAIAGEMAAQALNYDLVIASPARRVVETLAVLNEAGRDLTILYVERAYLASPETLLDIVRNADPAAQSLLLVGHNPGLEQLALLLSRDQGGQRRRDLALKFPTASLAEIVFSADDWRDVAPGSGELGRFVRPRDLDPELGPED